MRVDFFIESLVSFVMLKTNASAPTNVRLRLGNTIDICTSAVRRNRTRPRRERPRALLGARLTRSEKLLSPLNKRNKSITRLSKTDKINGGLALGCMVNSSLRGAGTGIPFLSKMNVVV